MNPLARRLALLLCLAAPGCADEEAPPLEVPAGCNPLAAEHDCLLPYPSDVFLADDPALPSGRRVALTEAARPRTRAGAPFDFTLTHPVDGFSPNMPILALFADAPGGISLQGVVFHTDDPERSLSPTSKVLLIDTKEGRPVPVPVWAELDKSTTVSAEQALLIRPFVRLQSRRRYVVALQDLRDGQGGVIKAPAGFARLRDGKAATTPALAALADRYERDVFPVLARLGVPRQGLQLAWDFTTSSEEGDTRDMLDLRADLLMRLAAAPPAVTITKTVENTVAQNENIWLRIEGTIRVPLYLEHDRPGAPLHRDAQGKVVYKGETEVPFTLQVPHRARPQDSAFLPMRVLQYGHGFFGLREEINYGFMRGYTNEGGYVAAAVDWWGMSEPDLDAVTRAALGSLGTTFDFVDRLHQAMANMIALSAALRGPLSQAPELRRHGKPLYDPGQIYYYGISQGAIFGVTLLALNPLLDKGALSVGGGAYSLMMSRSASYAQLYGLLSGALPDALSVQKLTALSQSTWDRVDPMSYAHRLLRQPYPGSPAKRRVLMQIGIGDHSVNNLASDLLARAAGVPLLTPSPRPVWGLAQAPPMTPADEGLILVDFQLKTVPGIECRLPTEAEKNNVHEGVRRNPRIQRQLDAFFRPAGRIEHPCDGPCDPE